MEKTPSNKITALKNSMNIDIWVGGKFNQLFRRVSYTGTRFSKKCSSYWQNSVLCDKYILYFPFCLS